MLPLTLVVSGRSKQISTDRTVIRGNYCDYGHFPMRLPFPIVGVLEGTGSRRLCTLRDGQRGNQRE
jgi:hypothetical protein